jgi:hypothetical protein
MDDLFADLDDDDMLEEVIVKKRKLDHGITHISFLLISYTCSLLLSSYVLQLLMRILSGLFG